MAELFGEGEVDKLIAETVAHPRFDAANFAEHLPGNGWNLPDTELGWKRQAQEWGHRHHLVAPFVQEGTDLTFIVLTDRGNAFHQELLRRGITTFAKDTSPE